jgi:HlyD family secretion protein
MVKILNSLKFWKLPKKIWITSFIAILVLAFIFWPKNNTKPQFEYTKAEITNIQKLVTASGILTGKNSVDLKFKISGKISYLPFKTGDSVKKGQTIASLDTQDLSIALQQAQNTLRDKQAIVTKILDDVKDSDTDETFTETQLRTTAEVARDNAYDSVKAAQRAFQDTSLQTPISGKITKLPVDLGTNVSAGEIVSQIVDISEIVFEIDLDEYDIGKVKIGMPAKISLNSYPNEIFDGSVSEIQTSTKTTDSGATVVVVKIKLSDTSLMFIQGLNGQAEIITSEKTNVLAIPIDSVREDNTVLVKTTEGFEIKTVTTGESSDSLIEVTSGLKPGDEVMLNPPLPGQENPKKFFGIF